MQHPLDIECCACGWPLPFAVMPMRNVEKPGEDSIIPNAIVTLNCPQCGRGHTFYSTRTGAVAPATIRGKLGIG